MQPQQPEQSTPEPESPADQTQQPTSPEQQVTGQEPIAPAAGASFTWEASEFVHHDKPAIWYTALIVIALLFSAVLAFFQQWTSIAVVVVMTAAIIVYSRKEPRTLEYGISEAGLSINDKVSPYNLFRSYSVYPEVGWYEIDLEPAKRFSPRLTLLVDEEHFTQISAILTSHLPRQDREQDIVERITRYVKF